MRQRLKRLAVVWVLGAAPAAIVLADDGPTGVQASLLIGVICAFVAVGFTLILTTADRLALLGAAALVGSALTVPMVGRMPLALALTSTTIADGAVRGRWSIRLPIDERPATTTLGLLTAASFSWVIWSNNLLTGAILLGSAVALAFSKSRLCSSVDRWAWDQAVIASEVWARRRNAASAVGKEIWRRAGRAAHLMLSAARSVFAPSHLPILLSAAFAAIVTAPIFHRLISPPFERVRGTNDIPGTIDRVRWMDFWPLRMPVPHPGWSITVKTLIPVVGEVAAVTLVLSLATGAATAILITIARSKWDRKPVLRWPYACTLGVGYVLAESPSVFAPRSDALWSRYEEAGLHARHSGYFPLHMWPTPTITMSMPFVFALFALTLLVLTDAEGGAPKLRRHAIWLCALTVVSTLVQPATTLVLVPAIPIYLVVSRRISRSTVRWLGWSFVLPGTLVVLWQVWFLVSDASPWERATWYWRPFWSLSHFGLDRPAFWSTFIFFAVCLWAGGRRYLRDPAVSLAIIAFGVGLPPFLLLEQVGIYEVPDGDLGVPLLMAFILWFVSSLRFLLIEVQCLSDRRVADESFRWPPWSLVAGLIFAVMIAAGVTDLLSASGVIRET